MSTDEVPCDPTTTTTHSAHRRAAPGSRNPPDLPALSTAKKRTPIWTAGGHTTQCLALLLPLHPCPQWVEAPEDLPRRRPCLE